MNLLKIGFLSVLGALVCHGEIKFERLPNGAIQPQAALDSKGTLHLIYFKGEPMGGNLYYTWRTGSADGFSPEIRVNSQDGSVIAAGTMRGAQMALGQNGRIHVAWMGGNGAIKPEIGGTPVTPMLYARLSDEGKRFESERNLITRAPGLDGGGSVTADQKANVYVVWHGSEEGAEGEENRAVFVTRSSDEGKTFTQERRASPFNSGVCACCGLKAFARADGSLSILFRAVREATDRPETLLLSRDHGLTFVEHFSHPWSIATCPASTAFLSESAAGDTLAAWETEGNVYWSKLDHAGASLRKPVAAGGGSRKKFPVVAENARGEALLVWNENVSWGGTGTLGWELFRNGKSDRTGSRPQVPAWSFGTVITSRNGDFLVLY